MATPRVRQANNTPASSLAPDLPRAISTPLGPALLSLHTAAHLAPSSQDALYDLFRANIAPLAKGTSMETAEAAKREEMFDRDARFLVLVRERAMPGSMPVNGRGVNGNGAGANGGLAVRGTTTPTASPHRSPQRSPNTLYRALHDADGTVEIDPADLVGYASFRFDTEETMGPKDVEVVYCYELQLVPAARGSGLGAVLMGELERIGRERGMRKSMLTCLTGNTAALSFYTKSGYTPDEIDPTRIADEDGWEDLDENGEEKHCDYRILSKVLR